MAQQVLIMVTEREDLRCGATGWTAEDPNLLKPGPIGNTPGFRGPYSYETPMHALAAGWKLLAPPTSFSAPRMGRPHATEWQWWFTREQP